jgi:hypothetical protein
MKRCTRCKKTKELSCFKVYGGYPRSMCIECNRIYQKEFAARQRLKPEHAEREKLRLERSKERQSGARIAKMFNSVKYSARARGITFDIGRSDIGTLIKNQKWNCARTGIPFDLTMGDGIKPFGPSVDRIDNARGYERDNIQVVCNVYNFAKSRFSDDDVFRFASALVGVA